MSRKDRNVAITPDINETSVQIYDSNLKVETTVYDLKYVPTIISGNLYGNIFATADKNGKNINVYNINDGTLLKDFNRGSDIAEINCIVFENYCRRMAVTSNKDTVH